jgi:hypothetical protein
MTEKKEHANQHTFRLVAIRVGTNNKQEIIRALKAETTYFFYNDYVDSYDENHKWRGIKKSETPKPIDPNFFSVVESDESGPIINVSAVVGKNGDGKSSLIEFLLRLVNNYAVTHGYNKYQETLQFIPGVDGIVYFEVDGDLFHICCDKDEAYYQQEEEKYSQVEEEHLELFYSIVMNYSLYAYNSHDLDKELGDRGGSWIDGLFHKNDSYQTPIVINPMRTEGNIDVNREHELSIDRLKLELINTNDRKLLDSKEAVRMDFTRKNSNTILEKTINPFFEKVIDFNAPNFDSMVNDVERCIERLEGSKDYVESNYFENFQFWIMYCDLFDKYKKFFEVANGRAICYRKANMDKLGQDNQQLTDWNHYLNIFPKFVEIFCEQDNKAIILKAIGKAKDLTKDMNSLQFQRVIEVIEVARMWSEKLGMPSLVNDLTGKSDRKHAAQYLVYKTISIFHKYRPYIEIIGEDVWESAFELKQSGNFSLFESQGVFWALNICFKCLFEEENQLQIKRSYETLKLRQTYNYLVHNTFGFKKKVTFDELREQLKKKSKNVDDELIALLPPPIYKADIMFQDTSFSGQIFPFTQLSSGEQQLILSMTGCLYHLRNLNYRTSDNRKQFYSNVNIILEEVELYFHPDFQRQYFKYLLRRIQIARLINIHAINILVVTHSPFVLSDIPKNNVLFLKEGRPVHPMQDETFGANIHNMLKNGFFLEGGTIGDFARWKINKCFDKLHQGYYGDDLKELIGMVGEPLIRNQLIQLYVMNRELYTTTDLEKRVKELESIIRELQSNKK